MNTRDVLQRCKRLFDEALPKFNWGASSLDANAIALLNEVPLEVAAILADHEQQAARVPEGCPTCKRTDGNVCDWCPSVAAPTEPSKPVAPPEREAPSIGQIIEVAESWQRGFMCPLCGHDQPHEHSPREITIYRNGVKWGLKNGTEQWPWKGYPSPSKNAGHDSKGVGRQGGHGTDQHHEHRVGQSGSDRAHDQSTGRRDGIHGACDVSAKVDATTPASAAGEREALRYAEMSMAAMREALMPSFEYVGVSLRVSQEDHAAIRSALAGMSTSLHMVRAALASKPLPEQVAQDSERLDWLERQTQGDLTICPPGNHGGRSGNWLISVETGKRDKFGLIFHEYEGPNLRSAIDAARTRGEGSGT